LCERWNYVKEVPGWRVAAETDENGLHTADFITPTGMHYRSGAPPAPGPFGVELSELEIRIGVHLADPHAA
jgi:hypothetical protein